MQNISLKELESAERVSDLCHSVDEPVYIRQDDGEDMVIMSLETFEKLYAPSKRPDIPRRPEKDL